MGRGQTLNHYRKRYKLPLRCSLYALVTKRSAFNLLDVKAKYSEKWKYRHQRIQSNKSTWNLGNARLQHRPHQLRLLATDMSSKNLQILPFESINSFSTLTTDSYPGHDTSYHTFFSLHLISFERNHYIPFSWIVFLFKSELVGKKIFTTARPEVLPCFPKFSSPVSLQ